MIHHGNFLHWSEIIVKMRRGRLNVWMGRGGERLGGGNLGLSAQVQQLSHRKWGTWRGQWHPWRNFFLRTLVSSQVSLKVETTSPWRCRGKFVRVLIGLAFRIIGPGVGFRHPDEIDDGGRIDERGEERFVSLLSNLHQHSERAWEEMIIKIWLRSVPDSSKLYRHVPRASRLEGPFDKINKYNRITL